MRLKFVKNVPIGKCGKEIGLKRKNVFGSYDINNKIIYVKKNISFFKKTKVIFHEFGHYIICSFLKFGDQKLLNFYWDVTFVVFSNKSYFDKVEIINSYIKTLDIIKIENKK